MVSKMRASRIAERIREELTDLLQFDVSDPRLGNLSITDVTVDRELNFADVYFSTLDGLDQIDSILSGFEHAQGYFRSELARRIELRRFPSLRFHWDPTYERAERIDKLINALNLDEIDEEQEITGDGQFDTD
jgi:ribosome-binding factor A